jgi:hypothetical protein
MLLYHLTNIGHLIEIENDEFLEVTESNIGAPEVLDGEPLPPMVPIFIRHKDGSYGDSHPDHPDFSPTVMPRQVYLAMHDQGNAPERIDMEVFEEAIKPSTEMDEDGNPVVHVAVVVGFEPDNDALVRSTANPEIHVNPVTYGTTKYGDHVGPDVVWLTDDPTPLQHWQTIDDQPHLPYMFRKNVVLITVEVPDEDAHRWDEWAHEKGILQFWYDALDGDTGNSKHWYVVPRRIPKDEWVSIHNTETGSLYWSRDLGHVEGDERFAVPMPATWWAILLNDTKVVAHSEES